MFCTNCGSQCPDGAPFCSNCGAKLGAAQARPVRAARPAAQPAAKPNMALTIVALVGAAIVLLSIFLPWVRFNLIITSKTKSLFGTGAFGVILGILLLLCALTLIAWEVANFVPALQPIKNQVSFKIANKVTIIDCAAALLAFLIIIIGMARGDVSMFENTKGTSAAYIAAANAFIHTGFGAWFAFMGITAVIVTKVINIIKSK